MDAIDHALECQERLDRAIASRSRLAGPRPAARRDCRECGAPIGLARLNALPGVQTCIECQRELEEEGA